ncbi:MAG TPA: PilZ domain-containing protein [Myxococcaceae bacterium]|nr:PilZ domain-containing protein [Myxococcaceae bacterium]
MTQIFAPVRSLPRLTRRLTISVHDGWKGEVVDLSAVGLRIRTVLDLPKDSQIEAALQLEGGRTIPIRARVVWVNPAQHLEKVPAELGLELSEVSEDYTRLVAELFAEAAG